MDTDRNDRAWNRRHDALYRAQLSTLYHQKRERFFDTFDKIAKAVAIVGGSAALAKFASPEMVQCIALAIASSSALSLVFGFSDRSKKHAELSRNFKLVEADILSKGEHDFTEADVYAWESKERLIETGEPAALGALVIICQNELAIAADQRDKVAPIPIRMRLFAHILDFSALSA